MHLHGAVSCWWNISSPALAVRSKCAGRQMPVGLAKKVPACAPPPGLDVALQGPDEVVVVDPLGVPWCYHGQLVESALGEEASHQGVDGRARLRLTQGPTQALCCAPREEPAAERRDGRARLGPAHRATLLQLEARQEPTGHCRDGRACLRAAKLLSLDVPGFGLAFGRRVFDRLAFGRLEFGRLAFCRLLRRVLVGLGSETTALTNATRPAAASAFAMGFLRGGQALVKLQELRAVGLDVGLTGSRCGSAGLPHVVFIPESRGLGGIPVVAETFAQAEQFELERGHDREKERKKERKKERRDAHAASTIVVC